MDGWHTVHDAVKLQSFIFVRCIVLVLFRVSALGRLMHLRVFQRLVAHCRMDILMAGKALLDAHIRVTPYIGDVSPNRHRSND